jgi:peptidase E
VKKCKTELLEYGIHEVNLQTYDFEYEMTEDEALSYDVIYFTGGSTSHLLSRIKGNGFDSIIKSMIMRDKTYVGVSPLFNQRSYQ